MKRIPAATLERVMRAALRERGVPDEHAAQVVDGLIETSLRGGDTHGVRLFPVYLAELDGGRARPRPRFTYHLAGPLDQGAAGLLRRLHVDDVPLRAEKDARVHAPAQLVPAVRVCGDAGQSADVVDAEVEPAHQGRL